MPKLADALTALSDKRTIVDLAEATSLQRFVGGKDVVTVVQGMLGEHVGGTVKKLSERFRLATSRTTPGRSRARTSGSVTGGRSWCARGGTRRSPRADSLAGNVISSLEADNLPESKIIYVAAKLDAAEQARLLAKFPPVHGRHFGHHCTLAFRPADDHPVLERLGEELELQVVGVAHDERGHAVKVRGAPSDNVTPHITISCVLYTQPVYSNTLLAEKELDAVGEPYVVKTRVGAFMDNGRWVYSRAEMEAE